jgi:hypothetical protein
VCVELFSGLHRWQLFQPSQPMPEQKGRFILVINSQQLREFCAKKMDFSTCLSAYIHPSSGFA